MAGGRPGGGLHRTPNLEGFWKSDLVRHASWNDAADPTALAGDPATVLAGTSCLVAVKSSIKF